MKSNHTMDSKYRCEGRINLPRRRVATKTCSENGDFEMELSLAIRESLKYARENELKLKQKESSGPVLNGAPQHNESFSCMAEKVTNFASDCDNQVQGHGNEVQQLKDLLLIHIELIQQQQELLTNKDKEIVALKNEKDTLFWRLQKAEKRIVQLKQKEDALEKQLADHSTTRDVLLAQEEPVASASPEKNRIGKTEPTPSRKRKRPQHNKPALSLKVKRHCTPSDKTAASTVPSVEDSEGEISETVEEHEDEEEDKKDATQKDNKANVVSHLHLHSDGESEDGDEKEREPEDKDPHPEPVLRTEHLYHVSCCVEEGPEESSEFPENGSEKDVSAGDQVETPGWRIKVLTNLYQLEGTENITDEAYEKRHQKHELEEKRRKRWDIQRLREQRVVEKLRGKEQEAAGSTDTCHDFRSFMPCIEELTHVEVAENVPVMAFGHTVPNIQPSEFELPWDSIPSCRKSHGGRGRLK